MASPSQLEAASPLQATLSPSPLEAPPPSVVASPSAQEVAPPPTPLAATPTPAVSPSGSLEAAVSPPAVAALVESALQDNTPMDADDVRRVRDDTLCVVHSQKQLELFCMKCQSLICMDCKLSEHLHHESHTLDEMADLAANQLSDDKTWLETVIADLQRNLEDRRNDQREFKDKKARVEREILRSHSTLVAAADKYRDDALADLKAASADTERMQAQNVDVLQAKLHGLRRIQRRIVDAEEAREGCRIITVAKEIKLGHGSQDLTKKFVTLPHLSKVSRPVHRSLMPEADLLFDSMKNFIGGARTVELKVTEPEVTIVERFRCEKDDDAVVFCVCPVENGAVWVSFEARSRHRKLPCKCFSEDGEMIRTLKSLRSGSEPVGRISIKERRGQGKIMFCTEEDSPPSMYAKMLSKDLYKVEHFKGKTYIGITHVLSEQPELCTCQTDQFSICCGPHRAFDANGKGNLFAVVTEPQGSDVSRDGRSVVSRLLRRDVTHDVRHDPSGDVKSDVKLYRRQRYKALDTYASPLTPFQPADVCFFTLRGLEVLLIADEYNDVIHVVDVQNDRLTFSRFLAPGCPLLLQPTALNTDHRGRLWVGCRGGRLVTLEPLSTAAATYSAQQ